MRGLNLTIAAALALATSGATLAQAPSPNCQGLVAQLTALDRGDTDPGRNDQIRRAEDAVHRQQYEVDYLLGRALGALAKFEAARAAYDRVVQSPIGGRTETAAMAQWMIGETYFQQEKYDEAIAAYHRVERLFGFERWQAAAILQAGKCHEAKGRYRDARQMYAQLLKQHAQTSFAAEASQRLRVAQQRAAHVNNRLE